jgi:Stigma-specific protein, Stig1
MDSLCVRRLLRKDSTIWCSIYCPSGQVDICEDPTTPGRFICTNVVTDPSNCGACGTVCPSRVCNNGTCEPCEPPLQNCGGTSCVDTQTDRDNCGGCGVVCSGGQICESGSCVCPAGETFCNGQCVACPSGQTACGNLCVNLHGTDPSNCGACGNTVGEGQVCVGGTPTTCRSGTACNGSCVDTTNDRNNCGSCSNVCPSGQICENSRCEPRPDGCGIDAICGSFQANCCTEQLPRCVGDQCLGDCPTGFTICGGTCCGFDATWLDPSNNLCCPSSNMNCPT